MLSTVLTNLRSETSIKVFSKYLRFRLHLSLSRNGQMVNYHLSDLDKVSQMTEWHLAI